MSLVTQEMWCFIAARLFFIYISQLLRTLNEQWVAVSFTSGKTNSVIGCQCKILCIGYAFIAHFSCYISFLISYFIYLIIIFKVFFYVLNAADFLAMKPSCWGTLLFKCIQSKILISPKLKLYFLQTLKMIFAFSIQFCFKAWVFYFSVNTILIVPLTSEKLVSLAIEHTLSQFNTVRAFAALQQYLVWYDH